MTGRISRAEVKATGTTTPRSLADWFSDNLNSEAFGIIGDGITEDGPSIQIAADYLNSIGGGTFTFRSGKTYKVSDNINWGGNVTIKAHGATFDCTDLNYEGVTFGDGALFRFQTDTSALTTISNDITSGDQEITVTSTSGMNVGDFVRLYSDQVQYHNGAAIAENVDINKIAKINGNVVTLAYPVLLDWDNSTYPVSFEVLPMLHNCYVKGGTYIGGGVTELNIDNNKGQSVVYFRGVEGCGFSDAVTDGFYANAVMSDKCINFLCTGLQMTGREVGNIPVEGVDSSFYGVVAVRTRDHVMRDCHGVRLRHVGDASQAINVTQDDCSGVDGHRASFGSHEATYNLRVTKCAAHNVLSTGTGISFRAANGVIFGCNIKAPSGLSTAIMLDGERTTGSVRINGNEITCTAANAGLSIQGAYGSLLIVNNQIDCSNSRTIYLGGIDVYNTIIKDNLLSGLSGIEVGGPAAGMNDLHGLIIDGNTITDYTTNAIILRGTEDASNPAESIIVSNNMCLPILNGSNSAILFRGDGYYGDNVRASNNSHFGDASLVVQVQSAIKFKSYPIVEFNDSTSEFDFTNRVLADTSSASVGTDATLLRGGILNRKLPSVSQPSSWTVTQSGTEGAVVGVTGSITTGTDTLTLAGNDNTKIVNGNFIIVTGAGVASADLDARVIGISDDFTVATLSTTASTTVAGAAVDRKQPVVSVTSTIT